MDDPAQRSDSPHPRNYTTSGRYIPQGGGSRGWFDNNAVAENERPNGYRYHEAVDTPGFKQALLDGTEAMPERRAVERRPMQMHVQWSQGDHTQQPGSCRDLSPEGVGLRVRRALSPGRPVSVTFLHRDDYTREGRPVLTVEGTVVWCASPVQTRRETRHDAGVRFAALSAEEQRGVNALLADQAGALVAGEQRDAGGLPGVDDARMLRPMRKEFEL